MSRNERVVRRARELVPWIIPHVNAVVGRTVRVPQVHGGYSRWGVGMEFVPYGADGHVKILIDGAGSGVLSSLCAHECGHAALYQAAPEWYCAQSARDAWPFHVLDEGFAEHVQLDVQLRLALRGHPMQLLRAARKVAFRSAHPLPANDKYTLGYRHVRRLRRDGVTLAHIAMEPSRFLPR